MKMADPAKAPLSAPLDRRLRRRWRIGPLALALAVQAGLLLLTMFIAIVIPASRDEPEFTAAPAVFLPQRELEHRVALAEFQQVAGQPPLMNRLTSAALMPEGLPPLPSVDQSDFNPLDAASMAPPDAQALLGTAALLGAAGQGQESAASFFGIEDSGERIVILVNTSVSVVKKAARRGVTIERIQEEMIRLIDGLDASTLFGIVQFSQGVRLFEDFLAPATQANKEAVRAWVPANLRGNPRASDGQRYYGHEAAFEVALRLDPDVIFLLTDGQLDRREGVSGDYRYPEIPYSVLEQSLRGFARRNGGNVRIHAIGFEMKPSDAEGMRRLVRGFGGEAREF